MILRHELVFAIGQVDGLYDQVVCMVLPHQPLQRHGVPHDDTVVIRADSLDGLLHVLVGDNLFRPSVVIDQVMAETAFMHDDGIARETLA